jgi:AbrB family looped-hinge helix DNA binding protein
MLTTRLSSKGQLVLPRSIRDSKGWGPGVEFEVEESADGVLLRPSARFLKTELGDVAGCLRTKRRAASVKQMNAAIGREVGRRRDSGRY